MMQLLETPRCFLEPLSIQDKEFIYRLYSNEQVFRHYPEPPIANRAALLDFMNILLAPNVFCWTIKLRLNPDIPIGVAALHHFDPEHKSMEIGGTLLPEFWGQGIMGEVFSTLMDIAKDNFQVNQILGKTQSVNTAAIRLVEKLGFEQWRNEAEETVLRKDLT